jgi:hypothetical protein
MIRGLKVIVDTKLEPRGEIPRQVAKLGEAEQLLDQMCRKYHRTLYGNTYTPDDFHRRAEWAAMKAAVSLLLDWNYTKRGTP